MNPSYSHEAEEYRQKVQAFLAEKLPSTWKGIGSLEGEQLEEFVTQWRATLASTGYLAPGWPVEYGGGGLSALEQVIVAEEFARAGVPTGGPNDVFGIQMLGNTLLLFGSEEQKRHYLPRIISGEDTWCQGYSEPNAGSDLSNVGLKATLDGDQWILNGQKIWTSAGHLADHIFTLARTDADAPKHKGISFLLVDMRQPGIEVRPIKMISGESEFNEVFYTDAVVPKENVVGGINNGWAVAMGLLGFERGEAAATAPIRFQAELDRLLLLAKQRGVASDPRIRQRLAWCYSKVQVMRFIGMRTLTQFLKGHHPGPDGAIFKLYWSEYHKVVTELGIDILGLDALVPTGRKPSSAFQTDDAGAPNDSMSWAMTFLNARAGTIYAGSSQIQKNIIGEMVLGLPKEPKPN
ncbi:MAG: acyl-CoA dehydrogenase [Actinobacteria bacterium]|jgi:alkylation response protein AidB-like acyl-CoA dehydrogenase|nr:acyl-CoA dehydrogenase [Actinomycetota bacterium]NCZ89381.1 acyl-CoA dehydrogenase [Actinomycetota bacterium]NCZ90893.1 acyl-CoA dehydrogenase [Actinomycetota bacterium]NCZ92452.1 acyl-CoA dehydrogenase [Actinomycetota bacterium]NDC44770.1 acyl-CoA dehydrogenase [Actinomycetota bacterium]